MQNMEKKHSCAVCKDPLAKNGEILMGYKGESYMDSGYFYCPYVPIAQTPVVLDPDVFIPKKGILSRYGKKLLSQGQQYYGTTPKKNKFRNIFDPWEQSMDVDYTA